MIQKKICQDCGTEYEGANNSLRCPACRRKRKSTYEKGLRHRNSPVPIRYNGSESICELCGQPYIVTGGKQRFCPTCIPRIPVGMLDDPITSQIPGLWLQGFALSTIADKLSISHSKVRRILIDLNLYTNDRIEAIKEMSSKGLTVDEIAEVLGVGRKTVISLMPYSRGTYNLVTPTSQAAYLRHWKKKKKEQKND